MEIAEAFAGAVQGLGNIGLGIYNAWRTQKNQEIQWQREDTALQRRVKDAEAAGFNKWSQLGSSGASSNTTVSAGTADPSMAGAAVDALNSMYKIATERESAKIAKNQRIISENQATISKNNVMLNNWQTALNVAGLMRDAGFDVPYISYNEENGTWKPNIVWNADEYAGNTWYPRADAPWSKAWDLDYQGLQNEAEQLQTDTDWQKTNYVVNLLSKIFGAGNATAGTVSRFRRQKK